MRPAIARGLEHWLSIARESNVGMSMRRCFLLAALFPLALSATPAASAGKTYAEEEGLILSAASSALLSRAVSYTGAASEHGAGNQQKICLVPTLEAPEGTYRKILLYGAEGGAIAAGKAYGQLAMKHARRAGQARKTRRIVAPQDLASALSPTLSNHVDCFQWAQFSFRRPVIYGKAHS